MNTGTTTERFACSLPTRIVFGVDTVGSTGEEVTTHGQHAMIVAAADSMRKIGALKQVTDSLERSGVRTTVFDDVQSDPTVDDIDQVARLCAKNGCNVVIGLGGGSAIDFAKGVAVGSTHSGSVADYMGHPGYTPKPLTDAVLPIVALPTTAGTGAEVTAVAVITIAETKEKHGIISPRVFPRCAVIDPALMLSLPARVTAGTGFDVIGHALEAYVSKFTTPFGDMVALESLRLAGEALQRVVETPGDVAARSDMAWAATLGGAAIANAGMTVAHGISQALGGRFHVPHGEAVAFCLPETMETVRETRLDRLANAADAMGFSLPAMSEAERADACIDGLKALRQRIGLQIPLGQFGIGQSDVSQIIEDTFETQKWSLEHHPTPLEKKDVHAILEAIL